MRAPEIADVVHGAAVDQMNNKVVIFALDEERVTSYASKAYGDLAIVEETKAGEEDARNWDAGPFPAGQKMYWPGGNGPWCSSGFNMRNDGGTPYMLTAAHCGGVGQQWHSAGNLGTVTNTLMPTRDVAFVFGGSYNNRIWRGGVNTSTTGAVVGVMGGTPNYGAYAGYSGARTGEGSAPYRYSGCASSYCNLYFFAGNLTDHGDSGGPWFAHMAGTNNVLALGVHRGREFPASGPLMVMTDIKYIIGYTSSRLY